MAHILIADDDAATRDLLRRALEGDGHTVKAAADGSEAKRLLAAASPQFDLLITDVQMPGIDGIALAGDAQAGQAGLRLILMSGYPEQLARASGLGPHARALSKPFTLEAARAEVKAALGG